MLCDRLILNQCINSKPQIMKIKLMLVPASLIIAFLFFSFKPVTNSTSEVGPEKTDLKITADVQKILDNSCFGCHNTNSKGDKAKKKLAFDTLDTLKLSKIVGKLADISEEVDEGKMPPEKFLEFKPEAKLTSAQKETLIKWADTTADALLKDK